jgi:hypothetical protein
VARRAGGESPYHGRKLLVKEEEYPFFRAIGIWGLTLLVSPLVGLVLAVVAFDSFTHGNRGLMFLGFPYPWIVVKTFEGLTYPNPTLFTIGMLQFLAYGIVFQGTRRIFKTSWWKCCIPVIVLHVGGVFVMGKYFF